MSKAFDRILIVMLENQYRSYTLRDPFLRKLAAAGADMRNYFGAFHPSQTNYLASLAGEVCAVTNDTPPEAPLMQETMVDVLEPAGVSWQAYMEGYEDELWNPAWHDPDYPSVDQPVQKAPEDDTHLARYFRKHNAFASFHNIQSDQLRWEKIVGERGFWQDVTAGKLPEYGWFSPDIWNDGHYLYNTHLEPQPRTQLIPQISAWLEHVFLGSIDTSIVQDALGTEEPFWGLNLDVDMLIADPQKAWAQSRLPPGTLLVITFDEADFNASGYDTNYDGPNQVYTVLLGDMIQPGTVIETPYNHYSLMKTVQRNFDTQDLGKNDRDANWLRFLWKERFCWSGTGDTGLTSTGDLALASDASGSCLVFRDNNGELQASNFDGKSWSSGVETGVNSPKVIALASLNGQMVLVYSNQSGQMSSISRQPDDSWSSKQPLGYSTSGSIALTHYEDAADGKEKLMLCWQEEQGFISFLIHDGRQWQKQAGNVGQLTDGAMALAQMGPSIYLVYKERNRQTMRMTSFNLAPFNAFLAYSFDGLLDPVNDTSLHLWSPFDVPVGHFSKKLSELQNQYRALGNLAMASMEGEMHLMHRAAFEDTSDACTEVFGLTGIFTAAHAGGHGWGTLSQTGWTREQVLGSVNLDPGGGIAMAGRAEGLCAVWQEQGTAKLKFRTGGYIKNGP